MARSSSDGIALVIVLNLRITTAQLLSFIFGIAKKCFKNVVVVYFVNAINCLDRSIERLRILLMRVLSRRALICEFNHIEQSSK